MGGQGWAAGKAFDSVNNLVVREETCKVNNLMT